ncbi:MAG: DUF512 domain-containing protein [Oscillospiraceae bacterium]|nr:DUF512 domain-containing protein [Oscillospiraceae bacterium]
MNKKTVKNVLPGSAAEEAMIEPGDIIVSINDHEFRDIVEYRYLVSEPELKIEVLKKDGTTEIIEMITDYEEPGIEFETGLIDDAQRCRNKCIFCFIDQLPKGMRDTVYFKDDDTRLSFLQGNYVTLTNMSDDDIDRMIQMRVSPINISVHTTNPELRIKMLNNRNAGRVYEIMRRFAENKMHMNCQIVLCHGYNDGRELKRTINDLEALYPYIHSVSAVPVGLTRYREGLCELAAFDKEKSRAALDIITEAQERIYKKHGTRFIYASDELYLNGGLPIPESDAYEGFPQLENGVGLIASMRDEVKEAVTLIKRGKKRRRRVIIATGELAFGFIREMADIVQSAADGVRVDVYAVKNNFFGGGVNVAGLVCGGDIIQQLDGKIPDADIMLIPSAMLRSGEEVFLDDTTLGDVSEKLGIEIRPCENDGFDFVEAVLGEELF